MATAIAAWLGALSRSHRGGREDRGEVQIKSSAWLAPTAGENHSSEVRVGQFSLCSQALLLPLGVPPTTRRWQCSPQGLPRESGFWRVPITANDAGNVPQGPGVPEHQVLSVGGAQHTRALCRVLREVLLVQRAAKLRQGPSVGPRLCPALLSPQGGGSQSLKPSRSRPDAPAHSCQPPPPKQNWGEGQTFHSHPAYGGICKPTPLSAIATAITTGGLAPYPAGLTTERGRGGGRAEVQAKAQGEQRGNLHRPIWCTFRLLPDAGLSFGRMLPDTSPPPCRMPKTKGADKAHCSVRQLWGP